MRYLLCGWVQANRASVSYEPLTEGEKEDIQRQVRQYLDGSLAEIEVGIYQFLKHSSFDIVTDH